jgi:glycosyltransferase involved in cell wall biosynthesis
MTKLISIVTPCYNENDNVMDCYEAVKRIFTNDLSEFDYEHIFCDNNSDDGTLEILKEIAGQDKHVKIIANARNYGPFRSNFNGVLNASGDGILVFLPADLQDPPELIPQFVKKWQEGYQVIYGIRKVREESKIMILLRKFYYRLVNKFAGFYIPPDVGEFQFIDRVVLDALRECDDYYPYIRGMIANCGFKATGIEFTWKARKKGFSKNSMYNLFDQGLNGFISSTNIPLRICLLSGFVISILSISYSFIQFVINLVFYRVFVHPGIATLIVALFFFSGVQLFFIGLLGEYIGAIHYQVRKRPLVVEKERINFSNNS